MLWIVKIHVIFQPHFFCIVIAVQEPEACFFHNAFDVVVFLMFFLCHLPWCCHKKYLKIFFFTFFYNFPQFFFGFFCDRYFSGNVFHIQITYDLMTAVDRPSFQRMFFCIKQIFPRFFCQIFPVSMVFYQVKTIAEPIFKSFGQFCDYLKTVPGNFHIICDLAKTIFFDHFIVCICKTSGFYNIQLR